MKNTYENIGFKGLITIFGYFKEVEMDSEGIFVFVLVFPSKKYLCLRWANVR